MALVAGSVSIADDGTVTKSGLAAALFDALVATFPAPTIVPPLGAEFTARQTEMRLAASRGHAQMATALATGLVPYITTNAAVSIAAGAIDSGVPSVTRATAGTIT